LQLAENNAFQFNKKKLKTSFDFDYDGMSVDAGDPDLCKWIGKIIYPRNLELEHTQILDEKQAFFTVSTNLSQFDKYPAQIIKAKMKSFILNHNLFYLDPKINSVEKIFKILSGIINSAYLKIKSFIDRILGFDDETSLLKKQNAKGKAKGKPLKAKAKEQKVKSTKTNSKNLNLDIFKTVLMKIDHIANLAIKLLSSSSLNSDVNKSDFTISLKLTYIVLNCNQCNSWAAQNV